MNQAQTAMTGNAGYTRSPTNNQDEGLEFERLLRVGAFLTLQDEQYFACEMKEAGKFDDLVVWVKNGGFYLRQFKHKQNKNFVITEKELFPPKSTGMFCLDIYTKSFWEIYTAQCPLFLQQGAFSIKELTLTTNVGFDFSTSFVSDYFDKVNASKVWVPLNSQRQSERYKFKQGKLTEIQGKLKNPANIPSNVIHEFLNLLVFEVKHPDIDDVKDMIEEKLLFLIPFRLNEQQAKKVSEVFQSKFKKHFDNLPTANAPWAHVKLRHDLLFESILELRTKAILKVGSIIDYEKTALENILEKVQFLKFSHEVEEKLKNSLDNFEVLNIIVPPNISFPILASCKVLSHFQTSVGLDRNKLWMMKINSEEHGIEVANIFEHPYVNLLRDCVFVVQFHQDLCALGKTSEIVNMFFNRIQDNKKLLKFIFITSKKLEMAENVESVQEAIDHISRESFTEETWNNILPNKSLPLQGGPSFSLRQFGIDLTALDSLSLSELVVANEYSHLEFPVMLEQEIEETYVHRKIRLPVFELKNINHTDRKRFFYDLAMYEIAKRDDPNNSIYYVKSLRDLGISYSNEAKEHYMVINSNNGFAEELRDSVAQSPTAVTIDEKILISDETFFDKSHHVKGTIIVDLPGMGKSTLLTRLCNSIVNDLNNSSKEPEKLVLRVNLGDCPPTTWAETPLDSSVDAIQFFLKHSPSKARKQVDPKHSLTSLSKSILGAVCDGRSTSTAILMLDGLDEISSKGRAFVAKLIDVLLRMPGEPRIIVASRPDGGIHEDLEVRFGQFAMHLAQLDYSNQQSLLVAFWREQLRVKGQTCDRKVLSQCEEFAGYLIAKARQQLTDENRNILDIPLQCILFAECFYADLKTYVELPESKALPSENEHINHKFDIVSLFNNFFDKKVKILHSDKAKHKIENDFALMKYEDERRMYMETMQRISVYKIMKSKEKFRLLFGERWNLKRFKEDVKRAKEIGLVAFLIEDELSGVSEPSEMSFGLIHRTFSEYFVAQCLISAFTQPNQSSLSRKTFNVIMDIAIHKSEFMGVRRFFVLIAEHMIPHDLNQGCPFSKQGRLGVIEKWPLLSQQTFNNFLAQEISCGRCNIFDLLGSRKGRDVLLTTVNLPLTKWLMLCTKEYVVRNLTASETQTVLEKISKNMSEFICRVNISIQEMNNRDEFSGKKFSHLFGILLHWYDQPFGLSSQLIRKCFFSFIKKAFATPIVNLFKTPFWAAVSSAVKVHCRYSLEDRDFNFIFDYFFKEDEKSCVTRHAVLFPYTSEELFIEYNGVTNCSDYLKYHLTLNEFNKGKYSLCINAEHSFVCFKEVLDLGFPYSVSNGDTSLLERQIRWFLSVRPFDSSENESLLYSYDGYHHKRELVNPFLVICTGYLLNAIDRRISNIDISNDFKKRVIRHALRLDVRLIKWLDHVKLQKDEDLFLENPVRKAFKFLPEVHQAAHTGELSRIEELLLANHLQVSKQLFQWTSGQGEFEITLDDIKHLDNFLSGACSNDYIPPALYLAAANHHYDICQRVLSDERLSAEHRLSFVASCIIYALFFVNDDSLFLPFLPVVKAQLSKEVFFQIFPCTERFKVDTLRNKIWAIETHRKESAILFTLALHRKSEFLKELYEAYLTEESESPSEIFNLIAFIMNKNSSLQVWSMPCVNSLLAYALDKYERSQNEDFFYSPICQKVCREIIYSLFVRFETIPVVVDSGAVASLVKQLRGNIQKVLSCIWKKGEIDFVTFVLGSEEHTFDSACTERSDLNQQRDSIFSSEEVQEYIPFKLSANGLNTLTSIITECSWDRDITWLDGLAEGNYRRANILKRIVEHAAVIDKKVVRNIAFFTVFPKQRPLIIHLMDSKSELAQFFFRVLDNGLVERANALKLFYGRKDVDSSKTNFKAEPYFKKCFVEFREAHKSNTWDINSWENAVKIIADSDHWMDIGIGVLKFLHGQLKVLLVDGDTENLLLDFSHQTFRWKESWYFKNREILFSSLTFAKEFVNTMLQMNDDNEITQLIRVVDDCVNLGNIPVVLAPRYLNFAMSLSVLHKIIKSDASFELISYQHILTWARERNFDKLLDHFLIRNLDDAFKVRFMDIFEIKIKGNVDIVLYDVIWALINLGIINNWFI